MSGRTTPSRPPSGLGLFSYSSNTPSSSSHNSTANSMQPIQASSSASTSTSVQVALRIRPPPQPDATSTIPPRFQRSVVHPTNGSTTQLTVDAPPPGAKGPPRQNFSFDRVIGPEDGQASVYEAVEPLVSRFMEGYNVTVLAYGQTSSGKSYTMGTDTSHHSSSSSLPSSASSSPSMSDINGSFHADDARAGIIPRAVKEIFAEIGRRTRSESGKWKCEVKTSYVEIYNEDLIDLLAGDISPDERTPVTIREDKAGHIIWSGLREVKVKNGAEVMRNLEAGSAIRQTGSTAMNDQSSRSHAIFSLTLTQRKYVGQGTPPPPRSTDSSPSIQQSSTFSTPSRNSVRYSGIPSRVASPTPSSGNMGGSPRPGTPGTSRLIPRPSSVLGGAPSPINNINKEEEEKLNHFGGSNESEWTTLVSKFHFVDLAGSERLKRTSAMGERAKEGISINGGLLALGNVISALGDPVKAKQTTHIPYRDSKLTRLLQDSLGGNAHTLMIACISPVEYNLSETLNTLKYANRARNIKNRAELNEIEAGWDDIEHLQLLVTRLRNELSALKGSGSTMPAITEEDGTPRPKRHSNSASLLQLQDQYADLSTRYAKLTAELAKAQAAASSPSTMSPESFAQAVEPVVEEYEKSISALESQLSLTKAALSHSEEIMRESEEKINSDSQVNEKHVKLINELRNRLNKVLERESVTEAYVRDLENRLKSSTEQDEASATLISDLKKEVAKYRETEGNTENYVKDLEARLARSEEVQKMQKSQIEAFERDIQRREKAYEELESRLSLLDTSDQHKQLLQELDERDKRILAIQTELEAARLQLSALEADTRRLQASADNDAKEKKKLHQRLESLEKQPKISVLNSSEPSPSSTATTCSQSLAISNSLTPPQTPLHEGELTPVNSNDLALKISDLEKRHEASLKDLDTLSLKYKESLKQIEELQSIQGIRYRKKSSAEEPGSSPENQLETLDDVPEDGLPDSARRSSLSPINAASYNTPTRAPRGSNSRRSMPLSPRGSFLGRSPVPSHSASHLRSASASLSQELSLAHYLNGPSTSSGITSSHTSHHGSLPPHHTTTSMMTVANGTSSPRPTSPLLNRRESLLQGGEVFFPQIPERSNESLQQEVKKLQETLNEREEEIRALEASMADFKTGKTEIQGSYSNEKSLSINPPKIFADDSLKTPVGTSPPNLRSLSPNTVEAFNAIKESMDKAADSQLTNSSDAQLARLDDLMLSMAKKEVAHQEKVQELEEQLSTLKKQHEELRTLSRDQVLNMSTEITALREQLSRNGAETKSWEEKLAKMDVEIKEKGQEVADMLDEKTISHEQALDALREEHSRALLDKEKEHEQAQLNVQEEHAALLRRMLEAKEELFIRKAEEYDAAIERVKREHQEADKQRDIAHRQALETLQEEANSILRRKEADHKQAFERLEMQLNATRDSDQVELATKLNEQHEAALRMRDEQHEETVSTLKASHAEVIDQRQQEYTRSLARLQEERETLLTKLFEDHSQVLQEIRQERDDAIKSAQVAHEQEVSKLVEQHKKDLDKVVKEVEERIRLLEEEHDKGKTAFHKHYEVNLASELAKLGESHTESINALKSAHNAEKQAHGQAMESMVKRHAEELAAEKELSETTLVALQEQHKTSMAALKESHAAAMTSLINEHDALLKQKEAEKDSRDGMALAQLKESHAQQLQDSTATHEANVKDLVAEHEKALADLKASFEVKITEINKSHAVSTESERAKLQAESAELMKKMQEAVTSKDEALSNLANLENTLTIQRKQAAEREKSMKELQSKLSVNDALQRELDEMRRSAEEARKKQSSLMNELQESLDALKTLEQALIESQNERERLIGQIGDLSKQAKTIAESEELTAQLAISNEEKNNLKTEVERLTALLSARRPISPTAQGLGINGYGSRSSKDQETLLSIHTASTTGLQEGVSSSVSGLPTPSSPSPYGAVRHASVVSLVNGSHPSSRPPPTPPPSMPPPPLPTEAYAKDINVNMNNHSTSSVNGHHHPVEGSSSTNSLSTNKGGRESVSSVFTRDSHMDNTTSMTNSSHHNNNNNRVASIADTILSVDPRVHQKFEEQEAALNRLTKRLEHAETELKANIDLVITLESALNDSERNLRKSRISMNDLIKERDSLKQQNEFLKNNILEIKNELDNLKLLNFNNEEENKKKFELQKKIQLEAQLNAEARMAEIQRLNRKSKFNCF